MSLPWRKAGSDARETDATVKDGDLASILQELGGGGPSHASDWREYYQVIRERLWVILLFLVLSGIAAATYIARQEARFQARAVIFLEQEQDRVLKDVKGVREEAIASLDMINTVVDLLCSTPFAQRVAEHMKLHEDTRFVASIPHAPGSKVSAQDAGGALARMVSAAYRKNTRLIDIFVTHPDPSLATALANGYADEYLRFVFEKRTDASKAAQQFLIEEADRLRKKMRISEEAMQSFREKERAASLENMLESTQAKLTGLTTQMSDMEQRMFQLDTDLQVASANADNLDELLRLPSVASEQKVARLTETLADQERAFALITQRYRAKHPAYIAARTQLDSLTLERKSVLKNVVSLLQTGREHLQTQYDEVKKLREEQEARLLVITGKSVVNNDLKRELETDTAMHQSVLGRMKEIDVTKGLTDSPIRIHERATGAGPVGVNPLKIYGGAIFAGLVLGVGLLLGLHFIDHSIKTVEQAEQISGLPVLAAIPRKKKQKGNIEDRTLDSVIDRQGVIAESFRSLRASVAMLANAETRRSFLFTSAMPSEGKTFCSTNFAVTLSQQGFRTLIIDADLRKPKVSPVFFGEHRKPGLSEVLSGQIALEEAIVTTEIENLSVLTAGGRAPNPAELIATPKMRELLDKALTQFDRVVIDTAPVLAVSDGLLIAPLVNVTCLVLRACSTTRKTASRALRALTEIKCRPAGVILNFLPTGSGSEYYYSGKYYGSYSSKGVYGTKT